MSASYIDFISAYCDRWCGRCAFTRRCSAFAAEAAIAMCGDVEQGIELAVGRPHPAEPDGEPPGPPDWLAHLENAEPTAEEIAEYTRRDKKRDEEVEATSIAKAAWAYSSLAHRWLESQYGDGSARHDPILQDALDVVGHDQYFVTIKLLRALRGRIDQREGEPFGDDHPVQNDWNGSAKVALISIERSEAAWRAIGSCLPGEIPTIMADHLAQLRGEVEHEFPDARRFKRPGFDDNDRQ